MRHLKTMVAMRGGGTSADTPHARLLQAVEEVEKMMQKHRPVQ